MIMNRLSLTMIHAAACRRMPPQTIAFIEMIMVSPAAT
jgi:hypothetical protein